MCLLFLFSNSKQTCTIDDFNLIKQILNQYFISEYMWINIKYVNK